MATSENTIPHSTILLVGGRGTRLGALTEQTPKPLLYVAGRPFLLHVLDYLAREGVRHVILATGYLAKTFADKIGSRYRDITIEYSYEETPLGTGGAIALALKHTTETTVFVLNGDTYFPAPLAPLAAAHTANRASLSMVLRQVDDISRYGQIELKGSRVTAMREKGGTGAGFINGGIYLINRAAFLAATPAGAFSLERELLPRWVGESKVSGMASDAYFIDIGIPNDLARAQRELRS